MASQKSLLSRALAVILPKGSNPLGTAVTPTFNKAQTGQVLSMPQYREHLSDIFSTRATSDSRQVIQELLRTDPDMSAALNAFLTVADTEPVFLVKNLDGTLDSAGQQVLVNLLTLMQTRMDYSTGFKMPFSMSSICEAMRYMIIMRGGIAGELVLNKEFYPTEIRMVDLGKLQWLEKSPGDYKPRQLAQDGEEIDLDIPTFFVSWYRRDPTGIYSYSPFLSAINTIAARQQVINDLYRIMQVTGYPRMEAKVLEEVILKNMPAGIKAGPEIDRKGYIQSVLGGIQAQLSSLRPDQAFIHTDSIEVGMINEKAAGMSLDISPIISTLNAQNQAGLKTMATIIGRGESGVNTASVEARIFSLSAQAINEPLAEFLSQAMTLALRLSGSQSIVQCYFQPVEMRSATELETQMLVRSQRLKDDLSEGLILDVEYHLWVYNRLPPLGAPVLSGTKFVTTGVGVDVTAISPNGDPVGRSATAKGGNAGARDNKSKAKSA